MSDGKYRIRHLITEEVLTTKTPGVVVDSMNRYWRLVLYGPFSTELSADPLNPKNQVANPVLTDRTLAQVLAAGPITAKMIAYRLGIPVARAKKWIQRARKRGMRIRSERPHNACMYYIYPEELQDYEEAYWEGVESVKESTSSVEALVKQAFGEE